MGSLQTSCGSLEEEETMGESSLSPLSPLDFWQSSSPP